MNVKCPHCSQQIDLVGAKDLDDEFGIGPNSVLYARKEGKFPEPWLLLGNRNLYLRSDIETWAADRPIRVRGNHTPSAHVLAMQISKILEKLPEEERNELKALIG